MKQFQIALDEAGCLEPWLDEIHAYCAQNGLEDNAKLFRILTDSCDPSKVAPVAEAIRRRFPDSPYAGSSGNGSIMNGASTDAPIVVTATVFERADSRAEVVQLPMTYETQEATANTLLTLVAQRPWVKSIEMMSTLSDADIPSFCERLSELPEGIKLYGGGALATDIPNGDFRKTIVFSSASDLLDHSVVFVLLGGPQLHVHASYLTGWRKLGRSFEVTASKNNILQKLNGAPALQLYHRYLKLPLDEHFYDMAVVFPFCFDEDGDSYLRVPLSYLEDDSLILGADIKEHTVCTITYGDPAQIMQSVNERLDELAKFVPETIQLYSCASRQFYWGQEQSRETLPFQRLAPTSGYYTSGECLRARRKVLLHNVTLVVAAMREGDAAPANGAEAPAYMQSEGFSRPIIINNCLTSFINTASEELEEVNKKLALMAVTDGLTGLFNRAEIERRVRQALVEYQRAPKGDIAPIAVMVDLDHFKDVNDTYGHQEGDEVLKKLAEIFTKAARSVPNGEVCVGRWGGEEFMLLIQGMDIKQASAFTDRVRTAFADVEFPVSGRHTLSAGVTQSTLRDTGDTLTSRADKGLYLAKESGRNQSVIVSIM